MALISIAGGKYVRYNTRELNFNTRSTMNLDFRLVNQMFHMIETVCFDGRIPAETIIYRKEYGGLGLLSF